ncbi:MAG TPA: bestrophin family ion channel [Bryobacteraceae bacterium]|nr:bestrophin family ion channel [Bryobacteraceae bacterium]
MPDAANMRSMLRSVWRPLVVLFAFDMLIAVLYVYGGQRWLSVRDIPLSIFGGAIGVIVGFRNTSSYQRWWEARTLWGAIVNYSRTFARQSLTMIIVPCDGSEEDRRRAEEIRQRLVLLQVAYVHSLRCQLRSHAAWQGLDSFYNAQQMEIVRSQRNIPVFIQQEMSELLAECLKNGWLDSMRWTSIDQSLAALMNAQGGAERIKNTPMPRQYDYLPRLFVRLYCFLLPFGMVANLGMFTPVGSSLVGLIFLALDEVGRDLENPFENREHDIPMSSISQTIEINLKQLLRQAEIPVPEPAVKGILW